MPRLFLTMLLLLGLMAGAISQDRVSGKFRVVFGKFRNLDGTYTTIRNADLPYVAERISARTIEWKPGVYQRRGSGGAGGGIADATVYNADAGDNYGIIDEELGDPSSLDDHTMVGAANKRWQHLTFGVDVTASRNFLIRWRIYTSFVGGRGHNASAFESEIADFGGYRPSEIPGNGTWKVQISVAPQGQFPGVISPTNTIFMAQQFREPHPGGPFFEDGEGPFDEAFRNVYNPSAPPSVGTSENSFFYDWDDRNGIYSEDEIDNFGQGTFANFLRTITVTGTVTTFGPIDYTLQRGVLVSGGLGQLLNSDDSRLVARPGPVLNGSESPVTLLVEAISPSQTASSLSLRLEAQTSSLGIAQGIDMWDWTTSAWVVLDTRNGSSNADVVINANAPNPNRFIQSGSRTVRGRIRYKENGPVLAYPWQARVDQVQWAMTN